jgi:hypothetical protein
MALITFPITTVPPYSAEFRCNRIVAESESPFSLQSQVYDWGGSRWEGEVTIECKDYTELSIMRAFLVQAQGKFNTFNYGDPEYLIRGRRGVGTGTPLVKGAGQTGLSLITDGWTSGTTNIMRAGDYIQYGTGLTAQLYMLTADVNSNGSGEATLTLNRPMISSPADNATIVVSNPMGLFRLSDNNISWAGNPSGVSRIVIPFKEAL